ncbi:hypothetical protein GCM10010277_85210 [Streptomyces longisporoflavus]|uniref:hypothetical protein n=1 Tax=Streptomyces longisporoflavus TaxID=28044 RepID=UPI00167E2985|nr:hypothetical protein [Streptomyces longisporoflavus]GGV72387.1 hypothetical protein GCM10010277_85210 [Streptomyces longisporoflavus]
MAVIRFNDNVGQLVGFCLESKIPDRAEAIKTREALRGPAKTFLGHPDNADARQQMKDAAETFNKLHKEWSQWYASQAPQPG